MVKVKKAIAKSTKTVKKTTSAKTTRKVTKKTSVSASTEAKIPKRNSISKTKVNNKKTVKPSKTKRGKDTGSVEVQIDNFTSRINSLIKHLKKHSQDNDSRRGLLVMVGKRRRLLNYIKKSDSKRYTKIVNKLKLKE